MSVAFSVSAQGYQWSGGAWAATENAYIGRNLYMTGFSFTPTENLRQITITFSVDAANSDVRCSMDYPGAGPGSSGTDTVLAAGSNTVTRDGSFAKGQSYTLWVWGTGGFWSSLVRSCSGTGEEAPAEEDGLARVYSGGAWSEYEARICAGGAWAQYEPHVYYNGEWRKMA